MKIKKETQIISKDLLHLPPHQELMYMRKTLAAFFNLQSANKILKFYIGGMRKLKAPSPCIQVFFQIAGEVKRISCNFGIKTYFYQTHHGLFAHNQAAPIEVCQLQKENKGKVIHYQRTRPLLLFQVEDSPNQIISDP